MIRSLSQFPYKRMQNKGNNEKNKCTVISIVRICCYFTPVSLNIKSITEKKYVQKVLLLLCNQRNLFP